MFFLPAQYTKLELSRVWFVSNTSICQEPLPAVRWDLYSQTLQFRVSFTWNLSIISHHILSYPCICSSCFLIGVIVKVRGVEEDDFRPSVHFCVLPSCFFVTMSHGDSFWLCFAFNGRRCFPAFNGVVQKYLDPSMALDRFSLNICPFSDFLRAVVTFFAKEARFSAFRKQNFCMSESFHIILWSGLNQHVFMKFALHAACSLRF